MDKAAILATCELVRGISPGNRRTLLGMAKKLVLETGKVVFKQDDPCPGMYCVGSGVVRIYRLGAGGKEHTLHMAGPGQTFAEVAVIGGFASPAYAEVAQTAECVLLPNQAIQAFLRADHAFCLELLVGMSHWVRRLTDLLEDITLRDASGRVARHLLHAAPDAKGTIGLAGLKKHIASHLNLTSETFSRVMRKLADADVVEIIDDKRLRVLDRASLESLGG